jgi:hypothetical protein
MRRGNGDFGAATSLLARVSSKDRCSPNWAAPRPVNGNSRHNGLFGSIDGSASENVRNRRKPDAF